MDSSRARAGSRRGLTLLEVAISLALLITLLVPIYLLLVRSREHASDTRLRQLARAAAEHQVERMREAANRGAFATIPDAFGGYRFQVPGLPPRKDGTGHPHGLVQVIVDESVAAVDLDGADSDGDGDPTNDVLDAASRFRALPVRVSIWWGLDADPQVELDAVVAKRTDYLRTNE